MLRHDRLAQRERRDQQRRAGGERRQRQRGQRLHPRPRARHQDEIGRVEQARDQAEDVAEQVFRRHLRRPPKQHHRPDQREQQCGALRAGRPGARDDEAVDREDQRGVVAEQGGVGELGVVDPDMPGGEIAGEQQPRGEQHPAEPAALREWPATGGAREQQQQRRGERDAPESGGDRPDIRHPHEPRAERERDIAADQRGESQRGSAWRGNSFSCRRRLMHAAP